MNSQDSEKIANLNLWFISLAQDGGALWRTKLGRSVHKFATGGAMWYHNSERPQQKQGTSDDERR